MFPPISLWYTLRSVCTKWFQRARENWVKFGERNTSYFHHQVNIRRRRNKIEALRDANGTWIDDLNILASFVFEYYANLYTQDESPYEDKLPKGAFPCLTQNEMMMLLRPFNIIGHPQGHL
ncbi:unnamed protein product [Linum trigynum]|uniref:Uncharacterized protein n=1 Tax=Linum trigynum TaxID=586398 RepID=A0AAV2CR46_9ROSI